MEMHFNQLSIVKDLDSEIAKLYEELSEVNEAFDEGNYAETSLELWDLICVAEQCLYLIDAHTKVDVLQAKLDVMDHQRERGYV